MAKINNDKDARLLAALEKFVDAADRIAAAYEADHMTVCAIASKLEKVADLAIAELEREADLRKERRYPGIPRD